MPKTCDFSKTSSEIMPYDFSNECDKDVLSQPCLCSNQFIPNSVSTFGNNMLIDNKIKSSQVVLQSSKSNIQKNFLLNFKQNNIQYQNITSLPISLIQPKQKRQKFTHEEDQIIISLVGDNQFPNWNEIASHIKGKTGRQCRERFQHYLSPKLCRDPWTPQEDQLIIHLYNQYGPNWALIAEHFDGKRTNNNIKNRYNNHIRLYKRQTEKAKNTNFSFNISQKPTFSPQPQIFPAFQAQPQPLQIKESKICNEVNNKKVFISSSPSDLNIPSISVSQKASNEFSAKSNLPEDTSFLMDNEDFDIINGLNADSYDFLDFGKLENDDLCDFDQDSNNLEYYSDFFGYDFK